MDKTPTVVPAYLVGDDKRTKILRAAQKLFLRDGLSTTSMDAITHEAGVSKATVYAYFASKEKLFETLIRLGSDNVLNMIPPLEHKGGEPQAELLAFFQPLINILFVAGGSAWGRLLIAEALRYPESARFYYACTIERITQSVERYLTALARAGLFAASDLQRSAEALTAMILVGPLHRVLLVGPDAVDFRGALAFGIELLLKPPPSA